VLDGNSVPKLLRFDDKTNSLRVFDKETEIQPKEVSGYYAFSPSYLLEIHDTLKECLPLQDEE
jgi:hypothetical protein